MDRLSVNQRTCLSYESYCSCIVPSISVHEVIIRMRSKKSFNLGKGMMMILFNHALLVK